MIIDLLRPEYVATDRGFYCNRETLLDAMMNKRLFVLRYEETDDVYKNNLLRAFTVDIFTLPCFCALDSNDEINILWVHPLIRQCSHESRFMKHFKLTHVRCVLHDPVPF